MYIVWILYTSSLSTSNAWSLMSCFPQLQSYYGDGSGETIGTHFFCVVGNELLTIPTGTFCAVTLGGNFMLYCFLCLIDTEVFLISFPVAAFFGTFLLDGKLPWTVVDVDDATPPAGDRLISSSKYRLFASSAATLSLDWIMAKVKWRCTSRHVSMSSAALAVAIVRMLEAG